MKEKKYVRVRITVPKSQHNNSEIVLVEQWRSVEEEREAEFLRILDSVLSEDPLTYFIKIRDSSGNIQIIPRDVLSRAIVSIEYGNHKWL